VTLPECAVSLLLLREFRKVRVVREEQNSHPPFRFDIQGAYREPLFLILPQTQKVTLPECAVSLLLLREFRQSGVSYQGEGRALGAETAIPHSALTRKASTGILFILPQTQDVTLPECAESSLF